MVSTMSESELMKKLQRRMDEEMKDPVIKAQMAALKNYFKHLIYIQPKLYEVLVSLNIALTAKEERNARKENKEIFTIYTKLDHTTQKNLLSMKVNRKTGLAIKTLIGSESQRMFPKVEGAPFNVIYSTLTLNNMTIDISRDSNRFKLCEILLADEEDIGRVWNIDEVLEIMGNPIEKDRAKYEFLYGLVKPFNERIEKQLGIPKFIDLNYTSVTINPVYIYAILKK